MAWKRDRVPGLKPQVPGWSECRAKARTYLRSDGGIEGNGQCRGSRRQRQQAMAETFVIAGRSTTHRIERRHRGHEHTDDESD